MMYVAGSVARAAGLGFALLISSVGFSDYRGGTIEALRNNESYEYIGRALDDADDFEAREWTVHDDAPRVSELRGDFIGRVLFGEHESRLVVTMRLLCDLDGEITDGNRMRLADEIAAARVRGFAFYVDDAEDFARSVTCDELDPLPFDIEPRSA